MLLLKKSTVALALLALTSATFAQEASPSPTPELQASPTSPEKRFFLELSQEDLNAVSAALIELPKKVADPLILKFNAQLQKQDEIRKRAESLLAEPPKKPRK